jgi:predicted dehydrogenase
VRSTTRTVSELFGATKLDALIVCVRNDLAPGVLDSAIDAGLPVLFEKPGALRAPDLQAVADRAKERGLTMGAMYQNRWSPVSLEARQVRRDGALGRVMAVEARMVTSQVRYRDPSGWLFKRDTAGSGILGWLGCHYIDMLCFLLEDRIVEVSAMVGNRSPEKLDVEDTACLTLRFASGVLGTLHAGYHLAGSVPGYEGGSYDRFVGLRGTDGHVRIPLPNGDGFELLSLASGWASGGVRERSFRMPESPAYGGVSGEQFVSDFLTAARSGGPAPAPIEDAVHVLEVIDAALESSATGRTVRIGGA